MTKELLPSSIKAKIRTIKPERQRVKRVKIEKPIEPSDLEKELEQLAESYAGSDRLLVCIGNRAFFNLK